MSNGKRVAVIGAGLVGIASALNLQRLGFSVTLIERGAPGHGASFGNGAVIGEEAVIPVATPGILRKVPRMLLEPLGPLAIRWSYLPRLAPWLLRFIEASRPSAVEEITASLARLMRGNLAAYSRLLGPQDEAELLRRSGWLCVYETEEGYRAATALLDLQARNGVRFEIVPAEEMSQLEPLLAPIFARGVFYPDVGYTVSPLRLSRRLLHRFLEAGGRLFRGEARGFEMADAGPRAVMMSQGKVPCDMLVLAAGAWSRNLACKLGAAVPLDTERGYHVELPGAESGPRLPVYSTERGVVVTPLEHAVRVAGTVELGGLRAAPDWRRADVLLKTARRWFPALPAEANSRWMGYRPSMPDSLPVISRSPRYANTCLAFGHGHCGVMLAARTAELVGDLILNRPSDIDLTPYRADRF